jgi:2'-5' RNA ligase
MMAEQAWLGGFDHPPETKTDRLLFLIYPDPETARAIAVLAAGRKLAHGLRGRPLALDRFHITLQHMGDHAGLPMDMVRASQRVAENLATFGSFDVTFDRVGSFGGRARNLPFVLRGESGLEPLKAFNRSLADGMALSGGRLAKWAKPIFTPHVTLLYDAVSVSEHVVEPIRWTVREFVLVHSLLGQTRHVVLDRWTLGG